MEIDTTAAATGGGSDSGSSIIKALATCNKTDRDKALRLLNQWLPQQSKLADEDMKKTWKGLFYCVWHSDKFQAQYELIERLASLLLALDLPLSVHYFTVFLQTMRREWSGIDALRLDKFYLLIRRFMSSFFELMKRNGWDMELCGKLADVLEQGTVMAEDRFNGNGVNYHVVSVYLEELKKFWPVKIEVVEVLIQPFVRVLGRSCDKVLVSKIKMNVFEELVKAGEKYLELKKMGKNCEEVDVSFGIIGLKLDLGKKLFELGSAENCVQGNRKVLFALSNEFGKLERDLKASGVEVVVPEVKIDDVVDEVPRLVAIRVDGEGGDGEGVVGASESNGCCEEKMSKKEKKLLKKERKSMKGIAPCDKKVKKKKKKLESSDVMEEDTAGAEVASGLSSADGEPADAESERDFSATDGLNSNAEAAKSENGSMITLDETVLSNLQMQFEKVAAEAGLENNGISVLDSLKLDDLSITKKKRKRSKSRDASSNGGNEAVEGSAGAATEGDKSAKRVRFSMKNNIEWKPQTPLPPQSVRIPPSVTPRGSALKKGVCPGPIRETSSQTKKAKQRSSGKKTRKGIKSPGAKRPKKLPNIQLE